MTDKPIFTTLVESDKPFTEAEDIVMNLLVDAHNAFIALPHQKREAVQDWADGIHDLQRILSMRTMRRLFPDYFVAGE